MPFDATKLRAHDVTLRPLPRSEGGGGPYRDRTRAGSATGTLHGGACVGLLLALLLLATSSGAREAVREARCARCGHI